MLDQFRQYITSVYTWQPTDRVLLAISGGVDSMVMMHLFREAKIEFGIAHMHFGLRGEESDRDSAFVREQAMLAGVPFYEKQVDTRSFAAENQLSIETAARALRYTWFEEIRASENYTLIATAHHAQDAAESMLMHLIRGTGLKGMTGITPVYGHVIRPLLFATRDAVLQYAIDNRIPFVEDSSNVDTTFRRNFVRHQILPACVEVNPAFISTMQQNARHFREGYMLMQERVDVLLRKWLRTHGAEVHMPVKPVMSHEAAETLLFAWLSPYGFNQHQIQDIMRSAGRSGNQFVSEHFRLITTQAHFILCHIEAAEVTAQYVDQDTHSISSGKWKLQLQVLDMSPHLRLHNNSKYIYFDADKLTWPLLVRAWKKGDYMYPFGLHKTSSNKPAKKKLSDLFTDAKYALTDKENALILCSGDHIVWVAGLRQDSRFTVTSHTKRVLRISVDEGI